MDTAGHFAPLGHFVGMDSPASAVMAPRSCFGRSRPGPSLIEDLEEDHYYRQA